MFSGQAPAKVRRLAIKISAFSSVFIDGDKEGTKSRFLEAFGDNLDLQVGEAGVMKQLQNMNVSTFNSIFSANLAEVCYKYLAFNCQWDGFQYPFIGCRASSSCR